VDPASEPCGRAHGRDGIAQAFEQGQGRDFTMAEPVERLGGQRTGQTRSLKQVVAASFIGTTIEWYDFFLYGTAAALVFNELFFPNVDPLIGTLSAFGTFAVGFARAAARRHRLRALRRPASGARRCSCCRC
jgi:hypothetical protein